jgi:5-formyltetrahydrofolate cyclo-ligase
MENMENQKNGLRARMKAERAALSPDEVTLKSAVICNRLSSVLRGKKFVMAYCALFNEVNVDSLMRVLISEGIGVAVPVTEKETSVITPSEITSLSDIKRGAYGIREPINVSEVPLSEIDAVLVPGLAFDEGGMRMGFGKGCYDRFLENYKGLKIGVCYEFQLVDAVPFDKHDVPMDMIVTESGTYAV